MLIFVYGGSGSGKSEYAETRIMESAAEKRYYIATMEAFGAEAEARIRRHRSLRAGKGFLTVECPVHPERLQAERGSAVLIEDLSNLLANEIWSPQGRGRSETLAKELCAAVTAFAAVQERVVVVGNDIFREAVPQDADMRFFTEMLSACHRLLAAQADEVVEVVCGIPLVQKKGQSEE